MSGARGCPGGLTCCRSRASLPGNVVTQRRWREPFPGVLPTLVVSEALRRPDGGGAHRFGGRGLGRLYEDSVACCVPLAVVGSLAPYQTRSVSCRGSRR